MPGPHDDGGPVWRWSATRMAAAMDRGDLSSRELVDACLARVEAVNPSVNAVVSWQADAARAAADAADRERARGKADDAAARPLLGVPITTKINVDQQGLPTSNGVVAYAGLVAAADSPVIAHLKAAGAIVIGRTNTPAFSMRWYTENDLHGRTDNPWRRDRTPGGSSGGAAVSVATGMVPIAHGNDGGGSIRYPAYCTGTVGLRPSFGRVPAFNATPAERPLSMQWVSVQGAITRTVDDAALALRVMMAPDPRDPWHVAMPFDGPPPPSRRIAVTIDPAGVGVDPAVAAAVRAAAGWLHDDGWAVHDDDPPDVAAAARAWNDFAQGEARLTVGPQIRAHADARAARAFALMMQRTPVLDVAAWSRLAASRATMGRRWQQFLQRYALVLCPVAMEPPLPYDVDVVDEASVDRLYRSHTFLFATAFLGLPSVSVPTGLVDGVPMGVQIIGARFREDLVLAAAAIIERRAGVLTPIDPRVDAPEAS